MKNLGISIYPEKAPIEKWIEYINLASKNGFTRIFSCLLSVDMKEKEKLIKEFKEINAVASNLGMEIIVDIAPKVFNELGISFDNLSFFKEIGADGIRLDLGFSGSEEAYMTFNNEGLSIEINMSQDTHTIDTIMDYMPNTNKLIGCHNFYPHNYTGLSEEFFIKTSKNFKKYGLRTAAFINSKSATFGPWPVVDGLTTLEFTRNLNIDTQAKYFIGLNGLIDDVIISNCFASEKELRSLGLLNRDLIEFKVISNENNPEIENRIIFDELHLNRGDINPNLIRSTQTRIKYKDNNFNVYNPINIKKGDIIIESSLYGHYAGELQIALTDMPNSGKSNVVGKIVDEEIFLLERLKPWQKFRFIKM